VFGIFQNHNEDYVFYSHTPILPYSHPMIIGTGIDLIEVERIAMRVGRDSGFRELVFSKAEMDYCDSRATRFEHYAARFAAKEAFLKAIGRGLDSGLSLHEIEVLNDAKGKPEIRLSGQTAIELTSMNIRLIHVSLSHLKSIATAVVILES
jgi:holo-[acyl-carrier protein] synthase